MFLLKIFNSFRHAFAGFASSLKRERNFRIHLTAICYVTYFAVLYGLSNTGWAVLVLTFAFVLSNELMNTAVEESVDLKTENWNPHAKLSKDNAAASVLTAAVSALAVAAFLFGEPEKLIPACKALITLPRLPILLLTLMPAGLFIFGFCQYEKKPPKKPNTTKTPGK